MLISSAPGSQAVGLRCKSMDAVIFPSKSAPSEELSTTAVPSPEFDHSAEYMQLGLNGLYSREKAGKNEET